MFSFISAASSWLCCVAVVILVTRQPAEASDKLKFVTTTRVHGCPLTVYFHDTSRSFYLAPAFCITKNINSLLTDAKLKNDNFIGSSYLNLPVLVSDSALLTEARRRLATLLKNRSVEFLQTLSARDSDDWSVPILRTGSEQVTGLVRKQCRQPNCYDIFSNTMNGLWLAIENIQVTSTVRIPGSQLIELQHQVSIANRSQVLLKQSSRNVIFDDRCSNLRLHEIIKLNESCDATVLRSSYRRGHFVVEPVLCYEGRHRAHLGVVTLTLERKIEQVREILLRKLPSALHIDFLRLVSVEERISSILSGRWIFEPLRFEADGTRAELRVHSDSNASRQRLVSALERSPSDVLKHASFRLESQLKVAHNSFCTWMSQALPMSVRGIRNGLETKLSDYHPIDGLLCIRPAFKRRLAPMPDFLCANNCSGESDCQAFSTAGGTCELFLFNKCSLNVRECGCTRRGRIFVRRREGLEPGRLCPPGFGHDLCGVKYNVTMEHTDWNTARRRSESRPGLVIMADVINRAEMQRISSAFNVSRNIFWLGGAQRPGSAEPAGGWFWVSCNRPVSMEPDMWGPDEPNNRGYNRGNENKIDIGTFGVLDIGTSSDALLNDRRETDFLRNVRGFLSECVSPF